MILRINPSKRCRVFGKRRSYTKSQIAAEFTILLGFALLVTMISILFLYDTGKDRNDEKIDSKMYDFGYSLQNEFILAAEMNNGYVRPLVVKEQIESTDYNLSLISVANYTVLKISYNSKDIYFKTPYIIGNISKGENTIRTIGTDVYINNNT